MRRFCPDGGPPRFPTLQQRQEGGINFPPSASFSLSVQPLTIAERTLLSRSKFGLLPGIYFPGIRNFELRSPQLKPLNLISSHLPIIPHPTFCRAIAIRLFSRSFAD